ncbi:MULTISPECIES: glucan biosynthesis protein [Methylobacterium]|nr:MULTISPECIES: glucan biosynthesis protein [Methylobacterium]
MTTSPCPPGEDRLSMDPVIPGSGDHSRRAVLTGALRAGLAAGAVLALPGAAAAGGAQGAGQGAAQGTDWLLPPGAAFGPETLRDLARQMAKAAYAAPGADDLAGDLRSLPRDRYEAIRTAPGTAIWDGEAHGFAIEPLARGSIFSAPVELSLIVDGRIHPVLGDRARFEPGEVALPDLPSPRAYSGFRVRARLGGGSPSAFAVFQGASFFRLLARGQRFGVTARSLTLRPADARGEEFPRFRAFYIEAPRGGALSLHAIVDSESCVAALTYRLTPGDLSTAEVEGFLVPRKALDHLGLGGMQAAYLFGGHDRRGSDDARAAAYAASGLQIRNGGGEAIWRPVHNPESLQISSFLDRGPKGFGLMQRERAYADFEDDVQRWEERPSLWLEPRGDWGEGAVTLLEIPSDSEFNENVLAYWRAKGPLPAGTEQEFGYRQSWCWESPERPPLARVCGTRSGKGGAGAQRLFLVDFSGDDLFDEGLEAELSASPGRIVARTLYPYPERRTLRVSFELDPGSAKACELRLILKRGERVLSETWLYRWTP